MPCDPQCPVRELNNQLINMKEEKIATLRQFLEVTDAKPPTEEMKWQEEEDKSKPS